MSKGIDCFLAYVDLETTQNIVTQLKAEPLVNGIFLLTVDAGLPDIEGCSKIAVSNFRSSATGKKISAALRSPYAMLMLHAKKIDFGYKAISRMWNVATNTSASLLYSDRWVTKGGEAVASPAMDYYYGSVRDDFDIGSVVLVSKAMVREYCAEYPDVDYQYSGLYDFQLYLLRRKRMRPLFHVREFLYTEEEVDMRKSGEKQFDYVDPRNRMVQIENEQICTKHLKKIGAYIAPDSIVDVDVAKHDFSMEASVIIPVRNRVKTIADAVHSALGQEADFDFNVIVVDNHSTDGTTEIVAELASKDDRVVHIIPERKDLGIGGCWSRAFYDDRCGRFAVQLDSDDLYSGKDTLKRIVDKFYEEKCAMVIGSYRMCNFQLETLPPGLIDHKEWTADNGHNNALRINGLGAPRAFFTPLLRRIGMPNTSYGEDYAVGLAFSRKYRIGRIYDELYLCRRWEGNSDAALSPEKVVKNNEYKDSLRTMEIIDRKLLNEYWNREVTAADAYKMFEEQLEVWQFAAQNYAQLEHVATSAYLLGNARLASQYNPARIISTGAKMDKKTIERRPCFLCDANRPDEQSNHPILHKYYLLVNPYPILPQHFTITQRHHVPQAIRENYLDMMNLAKMLTDTIVFYNGPRCGASAPDHMHFQAGSKGVVPLQRDWEELYRPQRSRIWPISEKEFVEAIKLEDIADDTGVFSLRGYVCPGFVIVTRTPEGNKFLFDKIYGALPIPEGDAEPMMNVISWSEKSYDKGVRIVSIVLPRRKHRPDAYYAEGDKQMIVSPGAIDMGGLLIIPREEDFKKMSPEKAGDIISECGMSLDDEFGVIMRFKEM